MDWDDGGVIAKDGKHPHGRSSALDAPQHPRVVFFDV